MIYHFLLLISSLVCVYMGRRRFSGAEAAFRRALTAAEAELAPRSIAGACHSSAAAAFAEGLDVAAGGDAEDTDATAAALNGAAGSSSGDDAVASNDAPPPLSPPPPSSSPARPPPQMMPPPPPPLALLPLPLLSVSPPRPHEGKDCAFKKLRHSDALMAAQSGLARSLYRQV